MQVVGKRLDLADALLLKERNGLEAKLFPMLLAVDLLEVKREIQMRFPCTLSVEVLVARLLY